MSYSIEQLKSILEKFDLNDDSESADKEVQEILSFKPNMNSLYYKNPKKLYKIKTDLNIPKINLPIPVIKPKKETNVLSKRKNLELNQLNSFILSFIKTENHMRDTQEMKIKKRKFVLKMEPFKHEKKAKLDIRIES